MEKKRQRIENEKHFNDIMFFVNFQSIFLDKFYSKKFLFQMTHTQQFFWYVDIDVSNKSEKPKLIGLKN